MESFHVGRVLRWADSIAARAGSIEPPIDLAATAKLLQVKLLRLCPIIPRGALVPVEGGFELYVRDLKEADIEIGIPERTGQLTKRQRFVVAHELAHTWFYDATKPTPSPKQTPKNPMKYEEACDRAAGRVLVPATMLRRDLEREIGTRERIDITYIRAASTRFNVSPDVMIERLQVVEPSNVFQRCVLLARKNGDTPVTAAAYFGEGLLSVLPPPKIKKPVTNSFGEIPRDILASDGNFQGSISRGDYRLIYKKQTLSRFGDFLLQIDLDAAAPHGRSA